MDPPPLTPVLVQRLISKGKKLPLATQNYPSRGQSAVQELYQTSEGKLFLKKVSARNHAECQIDPKTGTLAERESWACRFAFYLGIRVPELWLIDPNTTVQRWFDLPDARTYKTSQDRMFFKSSNIFECALFDWVTGQVDRHDANYLYDYAHDLIVPVDSSHCFLKYTGSMPDYLSYYEATKDRELAKPIPTPVKEKLKNLIGEGKVSSLVPLKEVHELEALMNRIHQAVRCSSVQDILLLYRSPR